MKKLLCIFSIFFVCASAFSQTQNGYVTYEELGNTISIGRQVLQRTDHANLDTLTYVFTGSLAYDTINEVVVVYNGLAWEDIGSGGGGGGYWSKTGGRVYPSNLTDTVNVGSSTKSDAKFNVDGTAEMKSGADRALFVGEYNTKLDAVDLRINGAGYEYIVADTVMQSIAGSLEINQGGGYLPLVNTSTRQIWIDGADLINRVSISPTEVEMYSGSLFNASPKAEVMVSSSEGYLAAVEIGGKTASMQWYDGSNGINPLYYSLFNSSFRATSDEFYIHNKTTGLDVLDLQYDGTVGGVFSKFISEQIEIDATAMHLDLSAKKNGSFNVGGKLDFTAGDKIELNSNTGVRFEGAYIFPQADGAVNETLTTDGAGQIKWDRSVKSNTIGAVTVANTTVETEILAHNIPADGVRKGSVITIELAGQYSNASSSDDFAIIFKINGVVAYDVLRVGGNASASGWRCKYKASVQSVGSSGSLSDYAEFVENGEPVEAIADISPRTLNTTANMDFEVFLKWDNADAGNTFTRTIGIFKIE